MLHNTTNQTTPPFRERLKIYALATLSLIWHMGSQNKYGSDGVYHLRSLPNDNEAYRCRNAKYEGHNVAALVMSRTGEIVSHAFHANLGRLHLFSHAESALIGRLFGASPHADFGDIDAVISPDLTIVTSLESCPQCVGMMSLGRIENLLYIQSDPGSHGIGLLLERKSGPNRTFFPRAPRVISADEIGLDEGKALDDGYSTYLSMQRSAELQGNVEKSFFVGSDSVPRYDRDITSYLSTGAAFDVFRGADLRFRALRLDHPSFRVGYEHAMTNAECLEHAVTFVQRVCLQGIRRSWC